MNILSYNVWWKAMFSDKLNQCKSNTVSICLRNIAHFIDKNKSFDFVGLQEAANWKLLKQHSILLQNMNEKYYRSGPEDIVIFYDKKYRLDANQNIIVGNIKNIGRPFIILFFDNKLCIINVHSEHKREILKFDKYLKIAIQTKYNIDKNIYLKKLKEYDIVMMGDFNHTLNKKDPHIILSDVFFNIKYGRKLHGTNKINSCCDKNLRGNAHISFDHILTTLKNIKTRVHKLNNASDHLPITALIEKAIGYDFDGVLHTNVGEPDNYGQRHPNNYDYIDPKYAFSLIIDKICNEIEKKTKIYIITARDENSLTIITNFLNKTKLKKKIPDNNIFFTRNTNKKKIIYNLKLDEFYDDSCMRIVEMFQAGKQDQFNLKLFLVDPDNKKWNIIDNNNINILCKAVINPHNIPNQNKKIADINLDTKTKNSKQDTFENKIHMEKLIFDLKDNIDNINNIGLRYQSKVIDNIINILKDIALANNYNTTKIDNLLQSLYYISNEYNKDQNKTFDNTINILKYIALANNYNTTKIDNLLQSLDYISNKYIKDQNKIIDNITKILKIMALTNNYDYHTIKINNLLQLLGNLLDKFDEDKNKIPYNYLQQINQLQLPILKNIAENIFQQYKYLSHSTLVKSKKYNIINTSSNNIIQIHIINYINNILNKINNNSYLIFQVENILKRTKPELSDFKLLADMERIFDKQDAKYIVSVLVILRKIKWI